MYSASLLSRAQSSFERYSSSCLIEGALTHSHITEISSSQYSFEYFPVDWPDRTVGLGPDRTGLILVRSGPKVKDWTMKQSPFLVQCKGHKSSYLMRPS